MGFCNAFKTYLLCWWDVVPDWQKQCVLIGVVCGSLAFVIGVQLVVHHALSGANASLRRMELLVLSMVPLYSIASVLILIDARALYDAEEVLEICCGFYEAVVILAFTEMLLIALGGAENVALRFAQTMQKPETPFLKFIPTPFSPGLRYVAAVLLGIVQFCVVSSLVALVELVMYVHARVYCISPKMHTLLKLFPQGSKLVSMTAAMYCLTVFYFEVRRNETLAELFEKIKYAEAKFVCIKGVIMLQTMQRVICRFVIKINWLDGFVLFTSKDVVEEAEPTDVGIFMTSLACCFELLVFSAVQLFAYPVNEFAVTDIPERPAGFASLVVEMRELRQKAVMQREMINRLMSNDDLSDDEITKTFSAFDVDGSGEISTKEIAYLMQCARFPEITIRELVQRADANFDGTVTYAEFKQAFQKRAMNGASVVADASEGGQSKEVELQDLSMKKSMSESLVGVKPHRHSQRSASLRYW